MLKALELIGFKSFADRTRFEFPPGITVVVGPNGSGKSNVVDAIKWVLGEQSVKSLRGKEMSDVIFNGSSSRGVLNSAEATLTFENRDGALAIDSPEVHISRRVYRSGEGEYLINRQPCRLRDIRELFSGTGAATEAYSVIEQGKVDILLQSSPRDRRTIFEEAAGISRFKAKKVESLRRLERVEQNLLRLADIVDEVDNQLRSVRKQAGKAQRYREYSERLKELRLAVGAADWRRHRARAGELQTSLRVVRDEVATASAQVATNERRGLELESLIVDLGQALAEIEGRLAGHREQIAGQEATIEHERARLADLEHERESLAQRYLALLARGGDLDLERQGAVEQLADAERRHASFARQRVEGQTLADELGQQLLALRKTAEERRAGYMNLMRQAASISNQISAREQQASAAAERRERIAARLAEIEEQLVAHRLEDDQTKLRWHASQAQLDELTAAWNDAKSKLAQTQSEHENLAAELVALRERASAARERAALLTELEERFEGVGAGAKEVLLQARQSAAGPLKQVIGLVADLLSVSVDMAPLVDAVLGSMTQYLAVAPGADFDDYLQQEAYRFSGRVGFLPVEKRDDAQSNEPNLDGRPGVLGRADRFVESSAQVRPLVEQLLGRTWVVERLGHALALRAGELAGLQFVTLAGEVVAADGSILVGPRQAAAGLVSRRSELRALKQQLLEFDSRIREQDELRAHCKQRIARLSGELDARSREHARAQSEAAELRTQYKELSHREGRWKQQQSALASEDAATERELLQAEGALTTAREQLAATEGQLAAMEAQIAEATSAIEALDQQRRRHVERFAEIEVLSAKLEEQIARLKLQIAQLDDSQHERQRVLAEHRDLQLKQRARLQAASRAILALAGSVAEIYLHKEAEEAARGQTIDQRDRLQAERIATGHETHHLRSAIHQREEQIYAQELSLREVELEQNTLAGRLRDDYQLELAEIADRYADDQLIATRDEVEAEIAELRRKINHIGSVNLDALAELEELEARHHNLSAQHQDLTQAKSSLETIIGRINADSRRLLSETFETVRGHFQELFQKLFGGGHADLLLEKDVDILDSGVEIVARPPGKEPRSISLLSGGEKTLTCVALLLAVFRSRPSPFCVLDEVDAALDEANIERFVEVLKEFLAWTQFIIVTHSKRTMTCAQTLYGVTMQESGVSKRVSVRFEDVSDTGEILAPAGSFDPATDETQAA